MEIKKHYNDVKVWLDYHKERKHMVEFIHNELGWQGSRDEKLDSFNKTYRWFKTISSYDKKNLKYLTGDKVATLEDIKKYMLSYISSFESELETARRQWIDDYGDEHNPDQHGMTFEESFNENNLSCGYGGIEHYNDVKGFWMRLDHEKALSVAAGMTIDDYEIDLDGHRQYWLSRANIEPMLFSYFNSVGVNQDDLDSNLYNSNEVDELLQGFFPPEQMTLLTTDELEGYYTKLVGDKKDADEQNFNRQIDNLIGAFERDDHFSAKLEALKQVKF